LTAASLPSNRG
jgi:hypothetical protein